MVHRLALFVAVATSLATGCVTDHGAMTLLSSKNVELSRVDLKHVHFTRNVEASDGRFWFLFIPFGRAPTIGRAVDECLMTGRGDFMTSARVTSLWWTALLFSWESYRVMGDVGDSLGEGAREVEGVAPEVSGGGGRNPWPRENGSEDASATSR